MTRLGIEVSYVTLDIAIQFLIVFIFSSSQYHFLSKVN